MTRSHAVVVAVLLTPIASGTALAQPTAEPAPVEGTPLVDLPATDVAAQESEFFDMTMDELLGGNMISKARIYGYVRTNVERNFMVPTIDEGGNTAKENLPLEWSFPSFHLYGSTRPTERMEVTFNLFGDAEQVEVRNAYGNLRISDRLQIRAGLMYRRFDLFNDKLDQAPTFLGIEPPELFDDDHLMVPRTSLFAIHGTMPLTPKYELSYMVDTDNGEGGATSGVFPIGADVRVKGPSMVAALSAYTSNLGSKKAPSAVALGEGAPPAGILPWMAGDRYYVVDGAIEYQHYPLVLQAALGFAHHSGVRNPTDVLDVVQNAGINARQRERFLGANAGKADVDLMESDVVTDADYTIITGYARLGYTLDMPKGTLTPYVHFDSMRHPEVIQNEDFGGDDEAGFTDDGVFYKYSLGAVYKPYNSVAIKLDGSAHVQTFNGKTEVYPEVRFDISFAFNLLE
jgi:hypothetical protein